MPSGLDRNHIHTSSNKQTDKVAFMCLYAQTQVYTCTHTYTYKKQRKIHDEFNKEQRVKMLETLWGEKVSMKISPVPPFYNKNGYVNVHNVGIQLRCLLLFPYCLENKRYLTCNAN
jgi:hypothetical protein